MKRLLISIGLFVSPLISLAQGENNIWTFGFEANTMINFNTSPPTVGQLPSTSTGNTSHWASAVCRPNGQLRFYVRLKQNFFPATPEYYLFDPGGNPIAGSDLLTDAGALDYSMPVIIPKPGNPDQYYIFHCKDDGLYYSLLDMSLNGGSGGIVTTQKNIPLLQPGTVFTRLLTAVRGCNGTWLIIRSKTTNEYYSFHVLATGLDTQAVVSQCGNFPVLDYSSGGFLKASPDGSMLVTTNWAGIEWYDFEGCSGQLKNARILDTTGNPPLFPGAAFFLPNHGRFTGVAFSPDNSKLYVTKNQFINYEPTAGELFQFDLNSGTLANVIASKILIITNLPSLGENIATMQCDLIVPNSLGEIKSGPNGKLYISNGSCTCLDTAFVPPGFNPGPAFHVIELPNNTGTACLPQFNGLISPTAVCFYASGYAESYLQNEIVAAETATGTVHGIRIDTTACFADSITLTADHSGQCRIWDNGSTADERTVTNPGTYFVSYYRTCNFTTDTFKVSFAPLPVITVVSHSCGNIPSGMLAINNASGSNERFRAIWKDGTGTVLQDHSDILSDDLSGLSPGNYQVEYITSSGCDTMLSAEIIYYPDIQVAVSPSDTTIRYGDSITLQATGAKYYLWYPPASLDTAIKANPLATPHKPTLYTAIGIDENGCRDTGDVQINIDYATHDLIPNAFSPNGDGLNDIFKIEGLTFQRIKAFRIFNRFGQQVFSAMDGKKGWDGTQNGRPCDGGSYYYFIQLDYPDKTQKIYKGDVLLIR